jgi:predicted transcriptional regulator
MKKQTISSHEVEQWQLREIRAGIAEAVLGQVIGHSKVKAMAASWRSAIDGETSPNYFEEP